MRYHRSLYQPERLTGSYECPNYKYGRCAQTHTITQDKVKEIVWQSIQDQLFLFCDYEKVLELLENGMTTDKLEEYSREIQSLTLQLNSRRQKRERLYEDFTDDILTPEDYMYMKKRFDDEYQELNIRLNEVQARQARLKKSLSGKNEWMVHMREFTNSTQFSKEMLDMLVEKILIYQDADKSLRIEIVYKYAADRENLEEACRELMGGAKE